MPPLPLTAVFADLPDPRRDTDNKLHALTDVLVVATCAVIGGAESWDDIAEFGQCKEGFFRRFLPLANGIPSPDTFARVDGAAVRGRQELFALLDSVRDRESFGCELVGENGYKLTLGIGKQIGFVQHSPSDGDTPYLLALAPVKHCDQEYVEFLVGDTPTPVPGRFCLPFETVKDIAAYFVETGGQSPAVSWEEI